MGVKKNCLIVLLIICLLVTLIPILQIEKYEASEKIGEELLEKFGVSYDELQKGEFEDNGEIYSCIIWIQDVHIEEAVEAGIDAAERTRENYSQWRIYDYPYTTYESKGLTYVEVQFDDNESDEYVQAYIKKERSVAKELYVENNNKFMSENIKVRDMNITYVSKYSPCVFAELSISEVSELISDEDVIYIGYGADVVQDYIDSSSNYTTYEISDAEIENNIGIIRVDEVWEKYNVSGNGIKIGQIETYVPDEDSVIKNPGFESYADCHADNVYHIMSSIAPDATYYATGTDFYNFFSYVEWLLSQGVNIINMSAGFESNHNTYCDAARWLDHIAYNHDVHFVIGSGNDPYAGVPGIAMAYNVITVGAVEDSYPYERVFYWAEDGVLHAPAYNRLGVSLENHRTLKPDMTAPGRFGETWGTSYSTPMVSATIALMCEYKPALKVQQHVVKAILAATTAKEVTDAHYVTGTFDFMTNGAGLIDARSAFRTIQKKLYSTSTGTLTSAGDSKSYNMTVTASDTLMRIAVAHANRIEFPEGASTHNHATGFTDGTIGVIAIKVYDPDGNLVLSTYDDSDMVGTNLQAVEFEPETIGTYVIEVILKQATSDGRVTNFGIAWR